MTALATLQREQTLPLHEDAVALMFSALDGVKRYANNPMVTPDLTISVKTHVERLLGDLHGIWRDHDHAFSTMVTNGLIRRYQVHDFDEVICEQMTALEETHPQWQQALRDADPRGFQDQVTQFFYQLALYSCHTQQPDLFHTRIAQARRNTGIQTNGFGLSDKSPQSLINFYTTVRTLLTPDSTWTDWNHPVITASMQAMQHYYTSIETSSDFLGCLGKTLEKLDGTHYCLEVNARKQTMVTYDGILFADYPTELIPRVSIRYESLLHRMHDFADQTDDAELRQFYKLLANRATQAVYRTLRDVYHAGPAQALYRDRLFSRQDVLDLYNDLLNRETTPLPPDGGIVLDLLFDIPQAA